MVCVSQSEPETEAVFSECTQEEMLQSDGTLKLVSAFFLAQRRSSLVLF